MTQRGIHMNDHRSIASQKGSIANNGFRLEVKVAPAPASTGNSEAHFAISVEPIQHLLRIVMGGFFAENDIEALRLNLKDKLRALGCQANQHLTLCDVSLMRIQARAIVSSFSKVVGHPLFRSKRLAFVTGSSLARMQTRRLTDREGVGFFNSVEDVERWLLNNKQI